MNEQRASRNPTWGLLLVIPAAVILAKAATHHGYGHHARFGGEWTAEGRDAFRLPPRIERMLDTWHARAHQAAESTEPPTT